MTGHSLNGLFFSSIYIYIYLNSALESESNMVYLSNDTIMQNIILILPLQACLCNGKKNVKPEFTTNKSTCGSCCT